MSDFEIGSGLFFDHFARIELARWMHIPPGLSSTQRLPSWVKRIISSSAEEAEEAAREGDGRSEDGSSEDEETVDSLLWLAQMDLIAHRPIPAIVKLEKAAAASSSAACATLSSLFAKGLRQHSFTRASTSPVSPPLVAQNRRRTMSIGSVPVNDSEVEMDALLAAEWCIKGLAIELTKKVPGAKNGRRKSATSMHKRTGGVSDSPSEDESHEGKRFGLERALDLVVGLTDSYRFGILRPDPFSRTGDEADPAAQLFERGAHIAKKTLSHPAVALLHPTRSNSTSSDYDAYITSPAAVATPLPTVFASRPLLVPTLSRTGSPRRAPVARSYAHPSTSIPALSSAQHRSPAAKLQVTIQVHCFYLLALCAFTTDKKEAEFYWREIMNVSNGVVGTKEGDEIVKKTQRRLEQINGTSAVQDDWKLAKRRKTEEDELVAQNRLKMRGSSQNLLHLGLSTSPSHDTPNGGRYMSFGSQRRNSGDALSGIWKLKDGKANGNGHANGKGGWGVDPDEEEEIAQTPLSESPVQNSVLPFAMREPPASNLAGSRPSSTTAPTKSPSILEASHDRDSSEATIVPKLAKFHFAEEAQSPPASPATDRPRRASHSPPASPSKKPLPLKNRRLGAASEISTRPLRRDSSTSSFQPPRLLARVKSSASVSTLPPDFFSARSRKVNGSNWAEASGATLGSTTAPFATFSSSRLNPSSTASASAQPSTSNLSWKDSLRQRASFMGATGIRAATNLRSRLAQAGGFAEAKESSAVGILQNVLKKDDASAGPGMYWAEGVDAEDELEEAELLAEVEELVEEEEAGPSKGVEVLTPEAVHARHQSRLQRPSLRPQRSFIDPTRSTPRVTFTPSGQTSPTPGTPPDSTSNPSNLSIDPLLLALEKASRVGVRTKCATCGSKGLNYPACPRCRKTYCTRGCRVSVAGGGNGTAHVCGTVVDAKGKGKAAA